ncbi:GTP cyclohydrolase II [Hyphococcus sp.]|uniref:GTP cyclohydrolase II n=1 Tax=Hyphococcus sp. TaxID=2038636 RepID=UPI0035C69617
MLNNPAIASTPLRTKYGNQTLFVFSWSENEQDNLLALVPEAKSASPLVRVQSACYTGEIFGSLDCDCHWQLETSLRMIQKEGGAFIYMLKDGRGAGLLSKIRGMKLTNEIGMDTAEAYIHMGISPDPRNYEQARFALRYLKFSRIRLLTNNPRKVAALQKYGFEVRRVPIESQPTENNRDYLFAKATKLGHMMRSFGTDEGQE